MSRLFKHPGELRWWKAICRSTGVGCGLLALLAALLVNTSAADDPARTARTLQDPIDAYDNPTNSLGSWIWAAETFDRQDCQLWRAFELAPTDKVLKARLLVTVDNEFTLFLDGRELGRGVEWRELFDFDLTPLMSPGKHVLAVRAFNSSRAAGMLLGLRLHLAGGRITEIRSDASWRIVPEGSRGWKTRTEAPDSWPAATIIAPFGGGPWWTNPQNMNVMPTLQPIRVYFWQTGWFQITLLSVCGLVIFISLRLMAQVALHQKERQLLEQERARIARDIHDDIGSRMTQLVLQGEVTQKDLPEESKMRVQLDRMCEEARGLLSSMDEILWAVNPRRDTLRDFASYVCGYAQEFLKSTPIQCLFEVDPEISSMAFDLPQRRSLLMAIKEALNNAVKHSGATELRLTIYWKAQRLIVVVQDNGSGFDITKVKSGRHGLSNITQRLSELGGSCLVTSQPGKGCRVEFGIPLVSRRQGTWSWIRNWQWPAKRSILPKQPTPPAGA